MPPILHFFIGKGGVGKSTTSALTALHLARSGRKTLLVSLDPAHNQRDIFRRPFSEKPVSVCQNLAVKEIDVDQWIKTYLKKSTNLIKRAYAYQSAFNIQRYFNVLKLSPGLEEYALLLAFDDALTQGKALDDILFDMPPTALTLRFFSLPVITRLWLNELLSLRSRIYERKEIVSKIKFKSIAIEQDKVKARLQDMIEDSRHQSARFTSDATRIDLVLNNEPLSCSEAVRISEKMNEIGIPITRLLLNRCRPGETIENHSRALEAYPIWRFPHSDTRLTGLPALEDYLHHHTGLFTIQDMAVA
ncbi:MAG: ArsA family ATPase [Deltaproteobacteria bacterium]|nr:ArsA family ATPase [Deltaproteobacteria bacterium]